MTFGEEKQYAVCRNIQQFTVSILYKFDAYGTVFVIPLNNMLDMEHHQQILICSLYFDSTCTRKTQVHLECFGRESYLLCDRWFCVDLNRSGRVVTAQNENNLLGILRAVD